MLKYLVGLFALTALAFGQPAVAQSRHAGIDVTSAWARASAGMAKTGGAYITLENKGDTADRLVSASSPAAAKTELHTTVKDGDVMQMRPVAAIDVAPGGRVEFKPGGFHIMLMDLKAPLKEGESFPLTLNFEKAGATTVQVVVRSAGAMDDAMKMPSTAMPGMSH